MKKILLILLILTFMLPLTGAKKMDVIHSVWMISHPVFKDTSCITPGTGKLNEPRAEYFAQIAENCGATGMRFLPGLLIDFKLFPDAKTGGYNYLPWIWTGQGFDLSKQNPIYFENLKKLAAILKKHGLMLVFSMYDRCHWDNGRSKIPGVSGEMGLIPHSPWLFNINNIQSMYERTRFHDAYENAVLEVLIASGCKFKIEFVNEPRVDSKTYIEFTNPIYEKCKKLGIKQNQLIGGQEWFINGERNGQYDMWRLKTGFTDSFEGGKSDEQVGYAVVHCFTSHNLTSHHLYEAQNHTRRFYMSTDGLIIPSQALYENLLKYFALSNNKKRVLTWCFECLYQGNGTELYGSLGISEAINRHFGFYPGKTPLIDPNLKDPGNTPPTPPGPEPGNKITIISPREGESWKPGETHDIAWTSSGAISQIKLEYSVDNGATWIIINPGTDNDGIHPWVVPGIPFGQCVLKVSDIDGDPADTKIFIIVEPALKSEPGKKGNNVWLFIAAIGAAIITAVYFLINHFVITVLVLAVLLFAAAFIGYKKKWKFYYVYLIAAYALVLATGIVTNSPALNKALFCGAMGSVAVLSLLADNFYKKIKKLKKTGGKK